MEKDGIEQRRIVKSRIFDSNAKSWKRYKSPIFNKPTLGAIEAILTSNTIAGKLLLIYNTIQLIGLVYIAKVVYNWHINFVHHYSQYGFGIFLVSMIPGLIILPMISGLVVWPTFCIFRLLIVRLECQVESVQKHIDIMKNLQSRLVCLVMDYAVGIKIDAFTNTIANKIPVDIQYLILKTLQQDHLYNKRKVVDGILFRRQKIGPTMSEWGRVLNFWALFTGIRDEYGIPTHISVKLYGFNLLVLCRDGFLVCLSCLLRFGIIIWITR